MASLSKDYPFVIDENQFKTRLTDEHVQPFLTFLTNILTVLRIFMTDRQIENLAKDVWFKFVHNYLPRSSKGFLLAGKRLTDAEQTFFFCERTFRLPDERIAEWKNRIKVFSIECADTIFGELFAQAVLDHIRIHRHKESEPENPKMEVEWFKMDNLTWPNITLLLTEVCTFVQSIKSTKVIPTIDVNSAPISLLKTLPLIGPKIATNIVDERLKSPFTSFKDMERRVRKLGIGIINAFREFVVFNNGGLVIDENAPPNINTAPALILQELPKIGPIIAERIVNYRKICRFGTKDDLLKVRGIGPKTLDTIKDLIAL